MIPFIIKLLKQEKVWLLIITTLFASSTEALPDYWQILAGLLAMWVVIFAWLSS